VNISSIRDQTVRCSCYACEATVCLYRPHIVIICNASIDNAHFSRSWKKARVHCIKAETPATSLIIDLYLFCQLCLSFRNDTCNILCRRHRVKTTSSRTIRFPGEPVMWSHAALADRLFSEQHWPMQLVWCGVSRPQKGFR